MNLFIQELNNTRGMRTSLGFLVVAVAVMSSSAMAQVGSSFIVAPNVYEDAEAPAGMFTVIATNARTYQAIFHEDQLTEFVNHEINSMAYRLNGILTSGFPFVTTTWSRYEVELGVSVSPELATNTFEDNFLGDSTLVRSGSLTVTQFAWPAGPPGPSPWGEELVFDRSFTYEGGHLAVLIRHSGSDNQDPGNRLVDSASASSPGSGVDFTAISALGADETVGNQTAFVPVVRFSGTPIGVPEPSCIGILGSVAALSMFRRRRRLHV